MHKVCLSIQYGFYCPQDSTLGLSLSSVYLNMPGMDEYDFFPRPAHQGLMRTLNQACGCSWLFAVYYRPALINFISGAQSQPVQSYEHCIT